VADHENSGTTAAEDAVAGRNANYGLVLFFVYFAFYAGFMVLNAFYPSLMRSTPLGGVNLAILYGFGLIVAAFLLALVYMYLCRTQNDRSTGEG
jgi:uncharacterized membrane protein (DUF485 family)